MKRLNKQEYKRLRRFFYKYPDYALELYHGMNLSWWQRCILRIISAFYQWFKKIRDNVFILLKNRSIFA